MKTGRFCRNCGGHLPTIARADAVYCSSHCRTYAHRNPFPKQLTSLDQWIRFSSKKVPLTIDGKMARSNDRYTWSDYQSASESKIGAGIGFVFNGNGIIGIDLDHAIENGVVKNWAQAFIDSLPPTYTEISISGNGIHMIGLGEITTGRRISVGDGVIEVYGIGRYFTMTGKRFKKTPRKLSKLPNVVDRIEDLVGTHDSNWQTTESKRT